MVYSTVIYVDLILKMSILSFVLFSPPSNKTGINFEIKLNQQGEDMWP